MTAFTRFFFTSAALYGACAVVVGAFGSHALKHKLSPHSLNLLEIGVRYQLIHALVLCFTANLLATHASVLLTWASFSFFFGILLFSGSLYVLASGCNVLSSWGIVTPVGGSLLILGWILLSVYAFKG